MPKTEYYYFYLTNKLGHTRRNSLVYGNLVKFFKYCGHGDVITFFISDQACFFWLQYCGDKIQTVHHSIRPMREGPVRLYEGSPEYSMF